MVYAASRLKKEPGISNTDINGFVNGKLAVQEVRRTPNMCRQTAPGHHRRRAGLQLSGEVRGQVESLVTRETSGGHAPHFLFDQ